MSLSSLLLFHILALILTILVETVFAIICKYRDRHTLTAVILVQIITNPMAVYVANSLILKTNIPWIPAQIAIEFAVIFSEWYLYRKFCPAIRHPFLFSLSANALSYTIGVLLQKYGLISMLLIKIIS